MNNQIVCPRCNGTNIWTIGDKHDCRYCGLHWVGNAKVNKSTPQQLNNHNQRTHN